MIRQLSKSKLKETLWRIITAYDAGRKMDLGQNLNYELINVPVAIADSNGYLQSGNKSILTQELFSNVECPVVITSNTANLTPVIDSQALVMSLGHPSDCRTFQEYAGRFVRGVLAL